MAVLVGLRPSSGTVTDSFSDAEKTFITTRKIAGAHPEVKIIAVSHSDQPATDKWLEAVGGAGKVEVLVDAERTTFGKWGLGLSGWWQVINPWSMIKLVQMGRQEGIWNRPTESGSRWQTAGTFAVDERGTVTFAKVATQADDVCNPVPAVKTVT